jgi:hypothetical protein
MILIQPSVEKYIFSFRLGAISVTCPFVFPLNVTCIWTVLLQAVMSEPALYILLLFHLPNVMSLS